MDASLSNTLVAACAFAITFLCVRGFANWSARRRSQLLKSIAQSAPTIIKTASMNRSKRKRLSRQGRETS